MPVEFTQYPPLENTGVFGDTLFRLTIAYDYRSFGKQITMTSPSTGKERVDETFYDIF